MQVNEGEGETAQTHEEYTPTSGASGAVKRKVSSVDTAPTSERVATGSTVISSSTDVTRETLRDLSFPSSLPHLTRLSTCNTFLSSLRTLKTTQHTLERSLSTSYHRFIKTLRPSLDVKTRRYEEDKFVRKLMHKWEEGVREQQKALEELDVPCCCEAEDVQRRKRIKKVVEVLEGMLDE